MKKPPSRIFGFHYRYPQEFLDELAKAMGTTWTKAAAKTIPNEMVSVHTLGPPSNKIYYMDVKFKSNDE